MTQPVDAPRVSPSYYPEVDPTPTARATPRARELDVDSLHSAHLEYGALVQSATPVTTAAPARTVAQIQLDARRDAFSGPYTVAGQTVQSPAMFRMAGGFNDAAAGYSIDGKGKRVFDPTTPTVHELLTITGRAKLPYPGHCLAGCPSARELVSVTQALIDAGKLPPGPDLQTRIKAMQWNYGIGIDCTDYVIGAALAASGKSANDVRISVVGGTLPMPGCDYFATAGSNPHLARVGVSASRPGDVICLDDPNGGVGHRAVVYSNAPCSPSMAAELGAKYGAAAAAFASRGSARVLEMDSSWGAADGQPFGGVRRDTWLYDDATKAWAQINVRVNPPQFEVTPQGPADERLHGVYRFQ